jgi:hypothetical protein
MHASRRAIAATELVLILPAALFMAALVARQLTPLDYEPAHTAQEIVAWYSIRPWTLWGLLIGLPLVVLITGCATLSSNRNDDRDSRPAAQRRTTDVGARRATQFIAAATLAAGAILVVAVLHMLAN